MNYWYQRKEHLVFNKTSEDPEFFDLNETAAKVYADSLAEYGKLMLGEIDAEINVKAFVDGREYSFKGSCPDKGYKEILDALRAGSSADVTACFQADSEFYVEKSVAEYLNEHPDQLANCFFSIGQLNSGAPDFSSVDAYGTINGKTYNGGLEAVQLFEFPEGDWYADEDIYFEADVDDETCPGVMELVRKAAGIVQSEDINEERCDDFYSCYLNESHIRSKEDMAALTEFIAGLNESVYFNSFGRYVDFSGSDARVLQINYTDGKPDFELFAI